MKLSLLMLLLLSLVLVVAVPVAGSSRTTLSTLHDENENVARGGGGESIGRRRRLSGKDIVEAKNAVRAFDGVLHRAFRLIDRSLGVETEQDQDDLDTHNYNTRRDLKSHRSSKQYRHQDKYNDYGGSSSSVSKSKSKKGPKGASKQHSDGGIGQSSGGDGSSCEAELAQCKAKENEPRELFVQMAESCVLTKEKDYHGDGLHRYLLSSGDLDDVRFERLLGD